MALLILFKYAACKVAEATEIKIEKIFLKFFFLIDLVFRYFFEDDEKMKEKHVFIRKMLLAWTNVVLAPKEGEHYF